jgi:Cyclic nucleotide-binding domain
MTSAGGDGRSGLIGVLHEALGNAGLRRLQAASAAAATGEAAYVVGLTVIVYQLGGVAAVAALAVVRALPSVVVAPVLVSAMDRIAADRQLRLVLGTRVALVSLATLALAGGASIEVLVGLAGVDAVASTLLRPIRSSLVPALARSPEECVAANVGTTTGDSLAALVGPGLAAILLVLSGPAATLVAGTALLIVALVAALALRAALPGDARGARPSVQRRPGLGAGVRDLLGHPHARVVAALFVTQRFVRGMFAVLVVAAAIDLLRLGEPGVGLLGSAVGLGGLLGGAVALGLVSQRRLAPAFAAGIVAWGAGILLPGILPLPVVAAATLAVAGAGKVVLDVAGFSLLQRTVPVEIRGRVLGALEGFVTAALALGSLAAAWLLGVAGPGAAMVVAGALPIIAVAFAWRSLRAADDAAVIPDRELRVLRGVPLFRPLGLNGLERLAGAVAWVSVPAGDRVIRESETGDRFYVIETGRFEVTRAGTPVRAMGPGDSFGEIALLHARPRTATVTAAEDGTVASIDGAAFLAAVTGHRESVAAAEAQASERLAATGA